MSSLEECTCALSVGGPLDEKAPTGAARLSRKPAPALGTLGDPQIHLPSGVPRRPSARTLLDFLAVWCLFGALQTPAQASYPKRARVCLVIRPGLLPLVSPTAALSFTSPSPGHHPD